MSNNIAVVKDQIQRMGDQFSASLPAHIPVERFKRVVMTAIQNNGQLLNCDRKSLFLACVQASQDGLLPDGRDGALVPFKGSVRWMPMIGGIRKKVRNSGEISTWDVQAVYENDEFEFEFGDDPFIKHKPTLKDRGELIAVYSIATLKDGEKSRDIMGIDDVEKIRKLSQSQKGPWSNPTFYAEMAKKTVARRHSKVLPMSTDLDDLIRRDDDLYDLKSVSDQNLPNSNQSLAEKMDALADKSQEDDSEIDHDAETGEIEDAEIEGVQVSENKPDPKIEEARKKGIESFKNGLSKRAVPTEYREEGLEHLRDAWSQGFEEASKDAS